jgi:hypothetical protein
MHNSTAWGLKGAINVIQLCAGCNGGHAVMSDEVLVHFIALPIEFDVIYGLEWRQRLRLRSRI